MSHLHLARALLPSGWADDVLLRLTPDGTIADVVVGSEDVPGAAQRVSGVVVPGIPNLHSHAFQRAMAGLTERGTEGGDGFWSWRDRMYAFLERLDPGHVGVIAEQLFVELLEHGYTSVVEFHYLRNDPNGDPYSTSTEMAWSVLGAAERAGIGITMLPTLYGASDFGGVAPGHGQRRFVATPDAILSDIAELRAGTGGDPNVNTGLALHSLRAVSPDALAQALEGLDSIDPACPVHIHVAEQVAEVEGSLAWSGARPVEWLLDHAEVDGRWCAIHATHMTADETRRLAASGAVAGLCPTTEANLGDGIFPWPAYTAAGGLWGVGTDSHISVSPVADLRLLEYAQRLITRTRNVAAGPVDRSSGRVLVEGALRGGAAAAGRSIDGVRVGARADLVVLDPDHPALVGRSGDAVLDSWIFAGEDRPVRDVMVGGRWRVRDGLHVNRVETAVRYRAVAGALTR